MLHDNIIAPKTHDTIAAPSASFASPNHEHVIDLSKYGKTTTAPTQKKGRTFFAKIGAILDDRIHLHDMRARSVSVHPRGWRDFPPAEARTIAHALHLTAKRFFNEHPLAELTILSLAHLMVLLTWKILSAPFAYLAPVRVAKEEAPLVATPEPRPIALPILPIFAMRAPTTPAATPTVIPANAGIHVTPTTRTFEEMLESVLEPLPEPKTVVTAKPVRAPFVWPTLQRKQAFAFAVVASLFILPVTAYGTFGDLQSRKERVIVIGKEGVSNLQAAAEHIKADDYASAKVSFDAATEDFDRARKELGALATIIDAAGAILPDTSIAAVGPLMLAGREVSLGGSSLMAGIDAAGRDGSPTEKLQAAKVFLDVALPHFARAGREIAKVSTESVPEEYRAYIAMAQEKMPIALMTAQKVSDTADTVSLLLGAKEPKRYLVIFQNNSELRPTGGFMGSFALLDMRAGKVTNLEIPGGGTYDLKGQLTARVRSPQPLHLINPRWEFQDANWSPDFPTSAKRIAWFYSQSGGPSVNGVISVNATFMQKLLTTLGPVDMSEYGKTLDAQNFFSETQRQVELDYDKEQNKPKQFIADLAPKMLERVSAADPKTLALLAPIAREALATKEVMIWTSDTELRSRIDALGWSGEMAETGGDYLSIIHTNIAGQKTDLVMKDDVRYDLKILPDGKTIATLTIARTHNGEKGALFSGVRNVDYLRVYVPKGSTFIEAKGFTPPDAKLFKLSDENDAVDPEVDASERSTRIDRVSGTRIGEESGKTVFGNWVQTDPSKTSEVTLVYELPPGTVTIDRASDGEKIAHEAVADQAADRLTYPLLIQKQSGANPMTLTTSIDLPRGYVPMQFTPERERDELDRWSATQTIDRDTAINAVAASR